MNERLREERKRMGLTQAAVAGIGGVSTRTVIDWEKGSFPPTSQYLAAIATAGADVQYILTGIRSTSALAPDERLLLDRYRASPQAVKDAALRVVIGSGSQSDGAVQHIADNHGQVAGQHIYNQQGVGNGKKGKGKDSV